MADGGPATSTFDYAVGIDCEGAVGCNITNNIVAGKNPLYPSAGFGDGILLRERTDTSTKSSNNNILGNTISGIGDGGNDDVTGGESNSFINNNVFDCNSNRFTVSDPVSVRINSKPSGSDLVVIGSGADRLLFRIGTDGGLNLKGEYKINGEQVVGPREPAIPNSVGGDEVAKINSILTALRTHGLIEP